MERTWQTRLVQPDEHAPRGFRSLATPVWRGSTTLFGDAASVRDTWDHKEVAYAYGLSGTPTALELAGRIAELESGTDTLLVPGGQSALALVDLAVLEAGDHVLVPESVYGPNAQLSMDVLARFGVEVSTYPPTAGAGIAGHFRPNTRLVWCESPGSDTLEVQDVPAIAEVVHGRGALVALDNTWSAGVFFDAFGHGVDITVQALTKYVGGHSDLLLGSVTVRDQGLYRRLGATRELLGMAVSPDDCSLALRGLQTLAVRLAAIERSALEIAGWLGTRPEVERVLHPALPSCPGHEIWRRDFSGSSGLFSVVFEARFGDDAIFRFVDALELFHQGWSWGGVTSLAIATAPEVAERIGCGRTRRVVRLSIGLESTTDLIADLSHGFDSLG